MTWPTSKAFKIKRNHDETGISGTGVVAEGYIFSSGKCVVAWLSSAPCIQTWESFEDFHRIHIKSHPFNKTEIIWS